jgi:flagellar assembly protein FliH
MSTYSSLEFESLGPLPVRTLEYRDMGANSALAGNGKMSPEARGACDEAQSSAEIELAERELAERIKRERADAVAQTEQRLRQEYEQKLLVARASVASAISGFEAQRTEYFARVEAEVVQLALAISAKILHRESQVDPMIVAALVRMAVDKMREGSKVIVRVDAGRAVKWRAYFASLPGSARIEVVEDTALTEHDCLLETELGTTNFGLDAQLKEVEQGFFDLLALRPVSR